MPASIDLLILDVNDVIYRYDTERRVELLAEATRTTPDAVRLSLFTSGVEARSDSGELGSEEYLAEFGRHLGRDVDRATWTASMTGATMPMPDSIDLIRAVRPRVDTVGLSNNGLIVKQQALEIYPMLRDLDIELYVSAEFGGQKPRENVYLGLCTELGVAPHRAAFVDDKPANADGAAHAGLHAHRFTDVAGLREFFDTLGLPT